MKRLIVIGGPTASGKTDLAIQLAKHYQTEIVSADSRQCYREMNIGVAKPSSEELASVKHHFINSHSIHEEVSAGKYEKYALDILTDLFKIHDVVICVGGTGLYIKALCEGIDEMPSIDEQIKQQVNNHYEKFGLSWLQEEVKKSDPLLFANIDQQNPHRLQRGLVFFQSTGQSITRYQQQITKSRPFDMLKFNIELDRPILYQRIEDRVDTMIQAGLEEEAQSLLPFQQLKNLKTVGYQEFFDFFNGQITRDEAILKIKQHTRNYAKRQITWFNHQSNFIEIQPHSSFENVIETITNVENK